MDVKVTMSLVLHWPCITEFGSLSTCGLKATGAARHGQGGGHLHPPGNVQMGICNPSPEFLTVFVVGLSRISGVVPTYLRMKNVHDS